MSSADTKREEKPVRIIKGPTPAPLIRAGEELMLSIKKAQQQKTPEKPSKN